MSRKRMRLFCALSIMVTGISGCRLPIENEFVKSDRTRDAVIEALNEKDKNKLKSLFSLDAIYDAKDYEKGEEYLFSIFSGKCEMCEQTSRNSQGHMGRPGREVSVSAYYQVQFDGKQYKLYLFDYPINKRTPKKQGLYSMALLPFEEAENNKEYSSREAGIYYPGWSEEE